MDTIIKIRKGLFETNSSSIHALNVFKTTNYKIPEVIHIVSGQFGWEYEKYFDVADKLSYIYTWFINNSVKFNHRVNRNTLDYNLLHEYQKQLRNALYALGVKEVTFEEYDDDNDYCYIDHVDEISAEDINDLLMYHLADFLFNPRSYIQTGNDNSEEEYVRPDKKADWSIIKRN